MYGGQRFPYAQVSSCSLPRLSLNPHICTKVYSFPGSKYQGSCRYFMWRFLIRRSRVFWSWWTVFLSHRLPQALLAPPQKRSENTKKNSLSLLADVLLPLTLNKSWLMNSSFLVGRHRCLILLSLLLFFFFVFWKPWIFQARKTNRNVLIAFIVMC